jgi:hypothetical protein
MAWAMNYYGLNVDRGLLDAASFVRNAAEPGDSFMLIPAEPSAIDGDAAIRFASMADVPAHLSRAGIYVGKPWLREVVEQRLAQSRQIESAIDPKTAFELARRAGVTFLVTAGPGIPRFDPNHDHATFQTGDIAVYRLVQQ